MKAHQTILSPALIQAYLGTTYRAEANGGVITLKIGAASRSITTLFVESMVGSAAFITAENPYSAH